MFQSWHDGYLLHVLKVGCLYLQNKGFKGKEGTCILFWLKGIELKVAVRKE
jgi:hypothetical protein